MSRQSAREEFAFETALFCSNCACCGGDGVMLRSLRQQQPSRQRQSCCAWTGKHGDVRIEHADAGSNDDGVGAVASLLVTGKWQ